MMLKYLLINLLIVSNFIFGDKPLKVLFITSKFPSVTQTPLLNQAAFLIDRGVDLHIFAENKNKEPVIHDVIDQYDLLSKTTYKNPPNLNEYDIVHVQFSSILHRHLRLLSGYTGKLFCSARGIDVATVMPKYPNEIPLINKIVDLFLPVSNSLKEQLLYLGIRPERIKVLHSTINLENFPYRKPRVPSDGKVKILSVCRLVEKKGIDDALIAIAEVKKSYPNIEYTIIGDGEDKAQLVALMNKLNLQDVVTFAGTKRHDEVALALAETDLFLLPSKKAKDNNVEGIPNAIKEAMAVGMPVVSTVHAGIPELVEDGVSGLLVPEGQPKMLAKKLLYLINHPEIWESMGLEGRKVVEEEYDMNVVNEQLYSYYLEYTSKKSKN